jgi:microcystin-dependent protein
MAEPFLAEIKMFAGNFAPQGWAFCNGQILPINQNTALFSLIGTFYGGNGVTTFALPNLQGRVAVHQGTGQGLSPYVVGQSGGQENVTLTQGEMPQHNHGVNCDGQATGRGGGSFAASSGETPVGNFPALAASPAGAVYSGAANSAMNGGMLTPAGGNQPHSNIQPYLCVSFIIALQGIFPARN